MPSLVSHFDLLGRGSTVGREFRGAIATFLTMAYILAVNPIILKDAGVPHASAVACTALAAGVCSILMGWFGNFPMALASGMGLNAIVAYTVTPAAGTWQAAMGLIVLNGLLTAVLVLAGLREAVMRAIPRDLRLAIGAGIGLFIAFIGLVNGGLVVKGTAVPVAAGHLTDKATWTTLVGLIVTGFLVSRKIQGALILGILITTGIALINGVTNLDNVVLARPSFEAAFQFDLRGALQWKLVPILFGIVMVDFFDTLGTASAIAEEGKLTDAQGRIPRTRSILLVDSLSASIGGALGASSVTSYVESAAGVAEGARTGLHSIFVGLMFLLCIFAAPLVSIIPASATAPALILVGYLMIAQIVQIDFNDRGGAIAAFVTLLTIPLTYSIAHGIGYGMITFVMIRALSLRFREIHPLMYFTALAFLAFFIWGE